MKFIFISSSFSASLFHFFVAFFRLSFLKVVLYLMTIGLCSDPQSMSALALEFLTLFLYLWDTKMKSIWFLVFPSGDVHVCWAFFLFKPGVWNHQILPLAEFYQSFSNIILSPSPKSPMIISNFSIKISHYYKLVSGFLVLFNYCIQFFVEQILFCVIFILIWCIHLDDANICWFCLNFHTDKSFRLCFIDFIAHATLWFIIYATPFLLCCPPA